MKIFISWSGARSQAVAELLDDWLKCVLHVVRPWLSRDIDRGARWQSEINEQLSDTSVGIVCLTQENKEKPWILFEAGALAKGLSKNRVCTFLIDLKAVDVDDPLAQFNHTLPDREGLRSLVVTLNNCLESNRLDDSRLNRIFSTYWPQFDEGFKKALAGHPTGVKTEKQSPEIMLEKIYAVVRTLQSGIAKLEPLTNIDSDPLRRPGYPVWSQDPMMPSVDQLHSLIKRLRTARADDSKIYAQLRAIGLSAHHSASCVENSRKIDPEDLSVHDILNALTSLGV